MCYAGRVNEHRFERLARVNAVLETRNETLDRLKCWNFNLIRVINLAFASAFVVFTRTSF